MAVAAQLAPDARDLHTIATTQLLRSADLGRVEMLRTCAEHLVQEHHVSAFRAQIIAVQAYAEIESVGQRAHIDVDHTTAQAVAIKTPTGRVMLTVGDLMRLVRQGREDGWITDISVSPAAPR